MQTILFAENFMDADRVDVVVYLTFPCHCAPTMLISLFGCYTLFWYSLYRLFSVASLVSAPR